MVHRKRYPAERYFLILWNHGTNATEDIIRALIPLTAELLSDLDKNRKLIQWAWDHAPKFYDDNYLDLYAFARKLHTKSKDRNLIREKADILIDALKIGITKSILSYSSIAPIKICPRISTGVGMSSSSVNSR